MPNIITAREATNLRPGQGLTRLQYEDRTYNVKGEAGGSPTWVDDECCGYACECGKTLTLSVGYVDQCPGCGKRFTLQQRTWVEEVELCAPLP